jgi:hypothetical protein
MATEIKTWEIINGELKEINTSMIESGRKEKEDLEQWLKTEPNIIGHDIRIIGEQVSTESGPLDYLAIDNKGNLVIIELKRDRLPREALAQAIDYASDIANWEIDKISETCLNFTGQSIEDFIPENFENIDMESITINDSQRLMLVGFSIDKALIRMIEWLSDSYDMAVNAIILKYIKSSSGDELLSKTSIISEEIEKDKASKRKYKVPMSDEKGKYEDEELKNKLLIYFNKKLWSGERIRKIMIPYLIKKDRVVKREELKKEFLRIGGEMGGNTPQNAGNFISLISNQLGQKKNDYLRQIISYEYPNYPWEKDNFQIIPEYKILVEEVLNILKEKNENDENGSKNTNL